MPRSVFAGAIVALLLSGTETVASYSRPSSASGAFFAAAFVVYVPMSVAAAWLFSVWFGRRGLDLWLPLGVGALRMAGELGALAKAGEWSLLLTALLALGFILWIRAAAESATGSPPFLFGLTVGIVLPILAARMAAGIIGSRLGDPGRSLTLGVLAGLLTFILLRAIVAMWPRIGPVFLLGPIVSMALWSRQASPLAPHAPASPSPGSRPDIVLIVLDTVRAQALLSYGHATNTMPNLERFARASTTFSQAWTDASWTLPAHASLFSGLRPTRHRYDSGFDRFERSSPDLFLAPRLRRAGYATGAVAANFAVFDPADPLLEGFEHVDAEPLRPHAFRPWFFDLISAFPRAAGLRPYAERFPGPSMRAPWVVDRALAFWSGERERPRFLFVNLMEAHLPWIPEPPDLGRFGPPGLDVEAEQVAVLGRYLNGGKPTAAETSILRARYHEALHSLDRSLGRLLEAVTEGSAANTLVVVTSDHGESLGEHGRFGHRVSLDEEATRIPMMVRGPGLRAGETIDAPVQLVDLFLYLAESAGLSLEPGLDARPFGGRRAVVIQHRPGVQGVLPSGFPRGDLSALVQWPFKFIEGPSVAASLFDLSQDPGEERNLVAVEPSRAEAMRILLRELSGVPSSPGARPDPAAEERLRALRYLR